MPTSSAVSTEQEQLNADVSKFVRFVHSGRPGPNSYVVLVGLNEFDSVRLLRSVERGLVFSSFARLQRNLEVTQARLLDLVQIPQRTLTRRRQEGRLRPDESDRLLRVSRLFGRAIELFDGEVGSARKWLSTAQTVLGGAIPLDLARTELGTREVETAIARIELGIFA